MCWKRFLAMSMVEGGRTVSLAVARISPFGLRVIALRGELCAGMMLTFPVPISTICTCPGVRPGNATIFAPKQHRPDGLSAVSNEETFLGGEEKAYRETLLRRATRICERDRRAWKTWELNSSVTTGSCFASSQMMTWDTRSDSFTPLCKASQRQLTDLVGWELWVLPSAYKGDVVGSTKHLCSADTCIEVFRALVSLERVRGLRWRPTARDLEFARV